MKKDTYKIKEANKDIDNFYYIIEKKHGTNVLYGNILNGTKYINILSNTLDYAILDEQLIEHSLFIKLLNFSKNILETNDKKYLDEVKKLIGEDTVFFEKKTIYKVKKNEKN